MKQSIPTRKLPERPDLNQLRRQAKELLQGFLGAEPGAVAEVNQFTVMPMLGSSLSTMPNSRWRVVTASTVGQS
jgi:hypothetical protein